MIFKPFQDDATGCAAYLFGGVGVGVCAVVDPQEQEGKPMTTLTYEKPHNPRLALGAEDVVARLSELLPPKPAALQDILPYNQERA